MDSENILIVSVIQTIILSLWYVVGNLYLKEKKAVRKQSASKYLLNIEATIKTLTITKMW